jgi:hypothetical protein
MWLNTGPDELKPQSALLCAAFSTPDDCADLVQSLYVTDW